MNPFEHFDIAPWWRAVMYVVETVWCLILAGLAVMWLRTERESEGE